jgi:hexosaminidase
MPTNIVINPGAARFHDASGAAGYQSLLSNGYYIDLIQPTDFHYRNDPLPADLLLNDEQKKKILGGETTMWAEYVSPETVDSRIWPRTAAIAERFWSPQSVKDVDDMYRRLEIISFQLEEHGLTHEKNYAMMLRRLTRNQDIMALKNFVDVIEPVKVYNRGRLRPHTSYSPLTRVVDASRPDAAVARKFRQQVDRYLANQNQDHASAAIQSWLTLWQTNHQALLPIIKSSPVLAEIEPLSQDLAEIAGIGLEALAMLEKNQSASASWKDDKFEVLKRAKEPRGQAELMVVTAIEKLVAAASEQR